MNIIKTNKFGLDIYSNQADLFKNIIKKLTLENKSSFKFNIAKSLGGNGIFINENIFRYNNKSELFRLSKNVINNCKLINIDSINNNLNINDFKFSSIFILLDNDKSGFIKIERYGSDFSFIYITGLTFPYFKKNGSIYYDTYSFLTKEYAFFNKPEYKFILQILVYLYFGQITTKIIPSKSSIKLNSFYKLKNTTKYNITYVDSLWKQRISTSGFKVRGHFRLQPYGVCLKNKRLIWIEQFQKTGYNRKATSELNNIELTPINQQPTKVK